MRVQCLETQIVQGDFVASAPGRLPKNAYGVAFYLKPELVPPFGMSFVATVEYRDEITHDWIPLGSVLYEDSEFAFAPIDEEPNPRLLIGVEFSPADVRLHGAMARCRIESADDSPWRFGLDCEALS